MRTSLRRWMAAVVTAAVAMPLMAWADKTYRPEQEIGAWTQVLSERVVKTITVEVVRTAASQKDTFLNAAFGDGLAFENAQRKPVPAGDKPSKIVWTVNAKPNGKELRILSHHGKCKLISVAVDYKKD